MKVRLKVLFTTLIIGTPLFIITIALVYPFLPLSFLLIEIAIILLFLLLFYFATSYIFINRIEKLNQKLSKQKFLYHYKVEEKNEISAISLKTHKLIEMLQESEDRLARRWQDNENRVAPFTEKELTISKDRLTHLAHYDSLTALPNRFFFNEMLNKTLHHSIRHEQILAILLIDLDHFKKINDALGYEKGNAILKQIAERLTSVIRSGDIIARLGGDEFIVLLNNLKHPKYASTIAEKLLQICAKPLKMENQEFAITASIGICTYPEDGVSLEDLQKNADIALHKAKHSGGGSYHYFTKKMTIEANKHIQMDNDLRRAISNNEFVLHYQPKLNLANGSITGVEALIRWVNPDVGIVNPSNFIPHAEEYGLILSIGEWILREACRANKSWLNQGLPPITVAVNLSPKQFKQHNIVRIIENILAETDLDPEYLEIEITEMTVMDDIKATANKLNEMKQLGVKICIDDFGTGYTSINYLKQFPIDVLKVDQNFIKGIPTDQNDLAITSAIIALGHNLGMQVVAEGVETVEQLNFLAEHNCDLVQGYYFSRPLPEQKMILQLAQNE